MTRAPAANCSACGRPITSARLRGLCSSCLVRGVTSGGAAADEATPSTEAGGPLFRIPGHDVLNEIARGGMGIVYRARQHHPDREVALKMLLPGGSTPALRERFRNEARAMSGLEHRAVLPLYQFGEHGGTPWFTMKLAAGGTLADRLKSGPFEPRAAAALMAEIADAVAYAHQRGVLHRDLKPGNILFDAEGQACVADFGLAKLDSQSAASLTHSRAMLGTPHYLAPELARKAGTSATVATDVYALGAILYELLAGRPPYQAETLAGLLRSIIEDDPPSLLSSRSGEAGNSVPRALSAITGKAMAREPARRYRDAAAFAADLRAWLAGEAIEARPPGPGERFVRQIRRHPAIAASLVLIIAGVTAVILLQAKSARELRAGRDLAEAARGDALAGQAPAARASGRLETRNAGLAAAREAAALKVTDALRDDAITLLATPGWEPLGAVDIGYSDQVPLSPEHTVLVKLDAGRIVLHDLTGGAPPHAAPALPVPIHTVSFITPLANYIAVRCDDETHHLYDREQDRWVREWTERCLGFVISDNGRTLARGVVGTGEVVLEDLVTGDRRQTLTTSFGQAVPRAFSPDGRFLAVSDRKANGLAVVEVSTGLTKHSLPTMMVDLAVPEVAWRPDSGALAAAMGAADLYCHTFDAREPVRERIAGHTAEAIDVAWHPDGRWLATSGFDNTFRIWEMPGRREVLRVPVLMGPVQFSRDGTELACLEYNGKTMHRFRFQKPACLVQAPLPRTSSDLRTQRPPWACALSPDGLLGLTAGDYGMHWFDAVTGERLGWRNIGYTLGAGFNESGDTVFATSRLGVWRIPVARSGLAGYEVILPGRVEKPCTPGEGLRASWAPQRKRLAVTMQEGPGFIDFPDTTFHPLPAPPFPVNPCAISPDGRWIVLSGGDSAPDGLVIYDTDNLTAPLVLPGFTSYTYMVFSPDGSRLYVRSGGFLTALRTGTWEPEWRTDRGSDPDTQHQLALSGDGFLLAVVEPAGVIGLYAAATGRRLALLRHPSANWIGWLALDFSGSRLLATNLPDSVISWDLRELRRELAAMGLDWDQPPFPPAPKHHRFTMRSLPEGLLK